jgi:hypothetical protein
VVVDVLTFLDGNHTPPGTLMEREEDVGLVGTDRLVLVDEDGLSVDTFL